MFKFLKEEAFGITRRLLKRDFSGNTGLAVKNSIYLFATNVISKLGSLIFVYLIMMRYLSEEQFGLYSLALATILIFAGFSDLGIGIAIVRYVSKFREKSKGYIDYLTKLKIWLTLFICILLAVLSYFIANNYYQKPIFLALLAGVLYVAVVNLAGFFGALLQAENNFKAPFYREILFQVSRLILIPLIIFFAVTKSNDIFLMYIILGLSFCYLVLALFLSLNVSKTSGKSINTIQKQGVNRFILPLTVTVFSGVFFSYIDTIMLGRYVASEFIAYYQAAFSLASSAMILISFSVVLFPIFSKLNGKRLNVGLKKSLLVTIPLSILAIIATWFLAPYIFQFVNLITGRDYSRSILLLRLLSIILFTDPLIGIFTGYLNSMGKTKKVAFAIISSTIVNILLNYLLITMFLSISMYAAVLGATIATLISRFVYLIILAFRNN